MEAKLFISAASVEFEIYREPLRHALTRPNVSVKIQEDFKAGGVPTLIKLDDYLKTCDAVIHLVGDACGEDAPPPSVQALSERYADLTTRIPALAAHVGPGAKPLTYTQWEAWLALYHRRKLFVAKAQGGARRGPRYTPNADHAARQQQHLQALRASKVHAEIVFDSLDNLSAQLLASPILDLLLDAALAARLAVGDAAKEEFVQQEKRAGLPVPLFRYLWRELGNRVDLLGPLADAVRNDAVPALIAGLATPGGDAPEADLLRDAWRRVLCVRAWEPLAAGLGLPLVRWQAMAALVADADARPAPRFAGLRELLLWAMDLGERGRGDAALTQLLWLASETARQDAAGGAAADAIVTAMQTDDALKHHLAKAQAGPPPPQGPVRLYVELDLPKDGAQPQLLRSWVQHQQSLEPGAPPQARRSLGEQLQALASEVRHRVGRELHVELMAPLLLLCAQQDWLSYCESVGFAGLTDETVDRDFCENWPVSWRWQERLKGHPQAKADDWRHRAAAVAAKATNCAQLVCRFDDEPAEPEEHLFGLRFVPPAPTQKQRNLRAFIDALVQGAPYMLWPCDEAITCSDFKAAVRLCIDQKYIPQLPEALQQARKTGQLKQAVLFIDEPDRNPYELMGRLTAPD